MSCRQINVDLLTAKYERDIPVCQILVPWSVSGEEWYSATSGKEKTGQALEAICA